MAVCGHVGIGDPDPERLAGGVEFRMHGQASRGNGRGDRVHDDFMAGRGLPRQFMELIADLATGPIEAVWAPMASAAAAFQGKPVAVCGDLASRAELVALLVAIGVTELSVRPPLVGVIKQAVRAA